MGTSALVIDQRDGRAITIHWDGYPEWVGKILKGYYNTPDKVKQLIDLGNLSSLGESINSCVAYGRDYKDEDEEARVYDKLPRCNYTYTYINNKWEISK